MKRQKIEKDEMEKATNVNRKKGCNDRQTEKGKWWRENIETGGNKNVKVGKSGELITPQIVKCFGLEPIP